MLHVKYLRKYFSKSCSTIKYAVLVCMPGTVYSNVHIKNQTSR